MDLFGKSTDHRRVDVVAARFLGTTQESWEDLFSGFTTLKVITFSSSLTALMRLVDRFEDAEITFGSERILSREHLALEQLSQADNAGYIFQDAIADQKAFTEALARHFGGPGSTLVPRVLEGSLRFRVLRKKPSHEKLYLMTGADGARRVVAGSANLSVRALEGRQQETFIAFDDNAAYAYFDGIYDRDRGEAAPIEPDLIAPAAAGAPPLAAGELPFERIPCVRALATGATIIEEKRPVALPELSQAAIRAAQRSSETLRQLQLETVKGGKTVITAETVHRAWRSFNARPLDARREDEIPRAEIDIATGDIRVDGAPFPPAAGEPRREQIAADARLLVDYLDGFRSFFGDGIGAARQYWAILAWLYASPFMPALRRTAHLHDLSPLAYPAFGVLYGRSDGGKTMFSAIAARSMFATSYIVRGQQLTTAAALTLGQKLGAIPLIFDDVNRDRFTRYVPDLVKRDHELVVANAPTLISTNRDVNVIPPDLRKRMLVCHIDAARPKSMSDSLARRARKDVSTALFRHFLARFAAGMGDLVASMADEGKTTPDVVQKASALLTEIIADGTGGGPDWMTPVGLGDLETMKERPLLEALGDVLEQHPDRVTLTASEILVHFAGDHREAAKFEKLASAQALRKRFADTVTLDREALELEYGFTATKRRRWLSLIGRRRPRA